MCKKYMNCTSNTRSQERRLFDYIYTRRNDLGHSSLSPDHMHCKVFPLLKKSAFYNVLSRLGKSLEQFIVVSELNRDTHAWERQMILAKYYKKKGLSSYFLSETEKTIKALNKGSEYVLSRRLQLHLAKLELAFSKIDRQMRNKFMKQAFEDLFTYYDHLHSLYDAVSANQQNLHGKRPLEKPQNLDPSLTEFLSLIFGLAAKRTQESFSEIKNLIFGDNVMVHGILAEISLTLLINHCYFKIKQGDFAFNYEVLKLYEDGLSSGILLSNGRLSETRFLNMIELKSLLHPSEDHMDFINTWSPKTQTAFPIHVRNLALAYIHLGKEEYKLADDLTNYQLRGSDKGNMALRSRWLNICCDWALLSVHSDYNSVIKKHKKYFYRRRNNIGLANYEGSLNLLEVIKLLWTKKDVHYIRTKVQGYDNLVCRLWIDKMLKKGQAYHA